MKNVSDISFRENQHTHFMFNNFFFRISWRVWEKWKNVVELDRPQMTTQRMRFASCITKATETQSEYNYCFSTATVVTRSRLNITL